MTTQTAAPVPSTPERIAELRRARLPFVHATVVRAQQPTSARAGDQAVVLADGTLEGFVGGQCAAGSVRVAALAALQRGEGTLLRVLPENAQHDFPEAPGADVVVNPCLSGGALEIYLEPVVPPPLVYVAGESPIARSLLALAGLLDLAVAHADEGATPEGAVAAIIARHGGEEQQPIRDALAAGVPYVGLVASRRRGSALLDEMGLSAADRARVHTPAGLDIGARTAPEIALSILGAIVQGIRVDGMRAGTEPDTPREAIDPVCGMTVVVTPDALHLEVDGEDFWFCAPGCRKAFTAQHGLATP